ncbi:MAG: DegT/DnrJ/EryC1/StrS family aminotransferase [Rhodospirillales bacterium]|nr:DegT/DnrJ/EryC1/StrS family aminotransferase [Rhodospirillales bacterium]
MPDDPLPFIDLQSQRARIDPPLQAAIARVLEHGKFILGPEVAEFEHRLADFCGAKHAVSCANGTDALVLVLRDLGAGPGDAVLVPAFSFAATAEAVALVGATPVFVDVRRDTFNIDVESLAKAAAWIRDQSDLRAMAVIAVDLFGQPADYSGIATVAEGHNLLVIADAAQSFGARQLGRSVGTLSPITTTSFFPAKPLGCYGDGGAVLTDNAEQAKRLRSLRAHGKGNDKYDNVLVGTNSRLDTLQAAILIQKLAIFADEIAARERVAVRYAAALKDAVVTPLVAAGTTSVYAQYTIVLPERVSREELRKSMTAKGIPTQIYYPKPLHKQAAYAAFPAPVQLANSEILASRVLSLPMHPYLSESDQDRVIAAARDAVAP